MRSHLLSHFVKKNIDRVEPSSAFGFESFAVRSEAEGPQKWSDPLFFGDGEMTDYDPGNLCSSFIIVA